MTPETPGNRLPGDHPKEGVTDSVREHSADTSYSNFDDPHAIAPEGDSGEGSVCDDEVVMPRWKYALEDYTTNGNKYDNPRETGDMGFRGFRLETYSDSCMVEEKVTTRGCDSAN